MGALDEDELIVKLLRKSGKPVVLIANKVDGLKDESDASALWNLGLGEPHPVSALHGRGSGDALDFVVELLPKIGNSRVHSGLRRIALVGKPNVGKSSLLNKLADSERVVVDDQAGTTRDPVDEVVEIGGKNWQFVDTAGIRRRPCSHDAHSLRHLVELRMSVRLVVPRIEERSHVLGRGGGDSRRRDHPQAHGLAAARVHVARIGQRQLFVRSMNVSRVRSEETRLNSSHRT